MASKIVKNFPFINNDANVFGTDINNYVKTGIYRMTSSTSYTNLPFNNGFLLVLNPAEGGYSILQLAFSSGGDEMYVRSSWAWSEHNNWTNWKRVSFEN